MTDYSHVGRVLGALEPGDVITVNQSDSANGDEAGELIVTDEAWPDDVLAPFTDGFGTEKYVAREARPGFCLNRIVNGSEKLEAIVETVEVVRRD